MVLLILLSWEASLRTSGLNPEFADNRALWLSSRHQLSKPDPTAIAILGASRVQRAVNIDELNVQLQRPVVQLAVEGTSSIPVLENLAADPRFRGTVIVSIAPPIAFNRKLSKLDVGKQSAWVREYMGQSQSRRLEQEMRLYLQGLFSFRSADASVPRSIDSLLDEGTLPEADYKTTYRDRYVSVDMDKFEVTNDQAAMVELYNRVTTAYEEKGFTELLQYFSAVVDALNNKGCKVYFVRLPSAGKVLDYEKVNFPQEKFWDAMKDNLNANFVHFEDYPQLSGYLSIDGSHVAAEKATEFTTLLAQILNDQQI